MIIAFPLVYIQFVGVLWIQFVIDKPVNFGMTLLADKGHPFKVI